MSSPPYNPPSQSSHLFSPVNHLNFDDELDLLWCRTSQPFSASEGPSKPVQDVYFVEEVAPVKRKYTKRRKQTMKNDKDSCYRCSSEEKISLCKALRSNVTQFFVVYNSVKQRHQSGANELLVYEQAYKEYCAIYNVAFTLSECSKILKDQQRERDGNAKSFKLLINTVILGGGGEKVKKKDTNLADQTRENDKVVDSGNETAKVTTGESNVTATPDMNGSPNKKGSEPVCNEHVMKEAPTSYANKLSPTSLTKANLRKLDANVPNDADFDIWLLLASVHEGKPVKRIDYMSNHDSEDEVERVDNEMESFLASNPSGVRYGTNSLLEQCSETYGDVGYEYDPYDDDLYEGREIHDKIQSICDNLDIKFWATAKAKTVNGEVQIQALVDGRKNWKEWGMKILHKSLHSIKLSFHLNGNFLSIQFCNALVLRLLLGTNLVALRPQLSSPQKKQPRRKQRKDTEVPQPSGSTEPITDEAANEEHVPILSNDPLLSGEDRLKLNGLMDKTYEGLGAQEDASKQGRKIVDLDVDVEVTLVDEAQGRNDDDLMFDTGVFDEQEVKVEKVVSNAEVTTASGTTTTVDELTLAQTLIEIKAAKPEAVTTAITRPKARGVIVQETSEFTTTTSQPSQLPQAKDKGKGKMVKPEKPLKKKDQILVDEEIA
ncbi:hypothetical protein Tco_1503660 [Tanacetum coccineum]